MRTTGITALTLLLATALVANEAPQPDFSGTWVFNPEKSRLEMTSPVSSTFWIEHNGKSFKLTRTHVWEGRWDTLGFEAATDGRVRHEKSAFSESWKSMSWLGDELVLDMKLGAEGDGGTNVVHYRLEDEGRTLAAEWFHMPGRRHHNLWVFDRAPEDLAGDARDRVRSFAERYTAAWGSGDPQKVAAFFAENGSLRVNDDEPSVGREAIAELAQGFMTALPDMVLLFDGLEGRGEKVRFYWTLEATNSGPDGTGHRVRVSGHETWRLDREGLIAESQGSFPSAEYERQLEVGYEGTRPSG
jgi:nuclear transport factor 2 (NTF2) superfamily protein